MEIVTIEKSTTSFRVHFHYNTDLVDIMRELEGWWYRVHKAWQFPIAKYNEVYDRLTDEKYKIKIIKPKTYKDEKPKEINPFSNQDVVSVYGKCKKCNQESFIGKKGLCSKCNIEE